MYESAWIAQGSEAVESRSFGADQSIGFEDGPFRGTIERHFVRPGIILYRARGNSTHSWRLTAEGDVPPSHLVVGAMLSGAGALDAAGNAPQDWTGGGQSFAASLAEREVAYRIEPGQCWNSVTLLLTPDALEKLGCEDGLPSLARDVLANGRLRISQVFGRSPMALQAAKELSEHTYKGPMQAIWREGKALEVLTGLLDQLHEDVRPEKSIVSAREAPRIREAYQILLSDLRAEEGLNGLAARVSLSPRRLNAGFRQLYGMTMFEILLEERMKAAREMVHDRPDVPLKHIAWTVGYSQLSNFVTAYRRRFGQTPGQARRDESYGG